MFNLVNHSDTIACVLFELLVNLELIYVGFQTHVQGSTSFSFVQFSRSCSLFASCVTAYLLYLVKFRLSRTFLRFFEVFSRSEAPEKPPKAVVMRFSAAVCVALAPDSLTIIPPETPFVNTFFQFFWQIFRLIFGYSVQRDFLRFCLCGGIFAII